jgi:PEGA domain
MGCRSRRRILSMLAGQFRGPGRFALVVALVVASGSLVSDASARPPHSHHHHGHGGGLVVFPSFAIAIAPGGAPGPGVGVGLGLGFGYVPFSVGVGVALPGASSDPRGSLRLQVPERQTEVFIDGYYAGVVDDFDGSFQKLRLDPGPHTVTLYLDGFRLYEESINSTYGSTIKVRHEMEPLEPGEPVPMRPSAGGSASAVTGPYAAPSAPVLPPPPSGPTGGAAMTTGAPAAEYGMLSVRTQPSEVEFWIDGELWDMPPGSERLSIHLPAGAHDLRLRKEGYEDFELGVEIQPGETEALNVRMMPSP